MSPATVRIGAPRRAGSFCVRCIDYPRGLRQARHSHDALSVTIVLAGDIRETTRAGEAVGSALSIVVKPPGVEHENEVGPEGARTVQVACAPDAADLVAAAGLDSWRWSHGGPAASPLLALARAQRSSSFDPSDLEDLVLDAVAALGEGQPAGRDPPTWLVRAKEALDDHLETGIGARRLAQCVGVHPVSVCRAFRRYYGVTLTEYRRRERLRRAAATISASFLSLSRVAHGTGYADQAHLCREFRRLTGLTPSEFRRLAWTA